MFSIFIKGGPAMWPLLVTSLVSISVVVERFWFILEEKKRRNPSIVSQILSEVEHGHPEKAIELGKESPDFVAKTLVYALQNRKESLANALLWAANQELKRFSRGLSILDTTITLAPLLGLFGTVTGMISAFGLLGGQGLDSPTVITGGISEALIATAFGLLIAIIALIPFNFLNNRLEEARHEIEDSATHLELLLLKRKKSE
jgi:biopolymer transport protein ExbB